MPLKLGDTDETLLAAWRDRGDREALAALLERLMPFALAVARSASPRAAEDVVQDALVQIIERAGSFREGARVRPWLARIVLNAAAARARSEASRRRREESAAAGEPRVAAAVPAAVSAETARALDRAIGELAVEHRLAVVLHFQQGLTQSEVAEVLGITPRAVGKRMDRAVDELRRTLTALGFSAVAALDLGESLAAMPTGAVPASLSAHAAGLAAGAKPAAVAGLAGKAHLAAAAAKGGMAMKVVAGVLAAGVLAGGVAMAPGLWANGPSPLPSPAGRGSEGEGKPAPINDCKGMQDREEVFEFTQKPAVAKDGPSTSPSTSSGSRATSRDSGQATWTITFASKGKCDATVAIVDKDGRIVRHLASGVLGVNAPYPFQQDSLSQKVVWDGQTDGFEKAPDGCKVRVSLGLKATYDKSFLCDPYNAADGYMAPPGGQKNKGTVLVAKGSDGNSYVGYEERGTVHGKVFDKDGKYVKTYCPPPAADKEKFAKDIGIQLGTTTWGDKVYFGAWFGPLCFENKMVQEKMSKITARAAGAEGKEEPCPAHLKLGGIWGKMSRMTADPLRDELYYWGTRLDGKTGEADPTWFGGKGLDKTTDVRVGLDGLIYVRVHHHGYGKWLFRMDREGKPVPFKEGVEMPSKDKNRAYYEVPSAFHGKDLTGLWTGVAGHSMTHNGGFYVAPNGDIACIVWEMSAKFALDNGVVKEAKNPAGEIPGSYIVVWNRDGKLLSANALGGSTKYGHGLTMDRDGNFYCVYAYLFPAGQKMLDGITDVKVKHRLQGGHGSLVKFRGLGGKFPLGGGAKKGDPGAIPVATRPDADGTEYMTGIQWMCGGITCQCDGACSCNNSRYDMDYFARSFIPANQLNCVMVLDPNGNRIARLGRYGNVDDTEADLKEKKDGLRFAWMRAVAISDAALYVCDHGNRRILRAALSYAAEETVPLP